MKVCPICGKQYPDDANFCPLDAGRLEPDAGATVRGLAPAGGAGLETQVDAAVGGRFDLTGGQLGGGLTGHVFPGHDRQTGQVCAVKLVNPAVFPNPLLLQRAERELKQLERVELPEVARVLAHGRQGEQLWIAMELVAGVELGRLIVEAGPFDPLSACRLVRRVAHGLAEAAKQGVIHRDLASKNVLVGDGETIKIINFPIAVPYSDRVQGVPEFLSPEQVEGKPADQRSTIYSLGALLYFAVTGRPPFVGQPAEVHRAHMGQEPIRPSYVAPMPDAIEGIILKALEKASAKRFMTLHQMIGELDSVLAGAVGQAAVAAQGKGKVPAAPAQTLVGVSAFQQPVGPAMSPAGGPVAAVAPPMPAALPVGPAVVDPVAAGPTMPASNRVGAKPGNGGGRGPAQPQAAAAPGGVQAEGMRQPAVAVQTPPATPVAHLSPPASKKGKKSGGSADKKGKFRETMWFKKGELDQAAAAAAAVARDGELVADKADALPIEDRYRDDGTLDRQDAERFSLRTGGTAMMQARRAEPLSRRGVSERFLAAELTRNPAWLVLFLVVVFGALGGGIYFFFIR